MEWVILAALIGGGFFLWRLNTRMKVETQRRAEGAAEERIQEPWRGRQYTPTNDPEDKPDAYDSWEEAFNREVKDDLRFRIEYADKDGVVTTRDIWPKSIHLIKSSPDLYIKAHCFFRGDERTFFSSRIMSAKNLKTGRDINDLGQYLRARY